MGWAHWEMHLVGCSMGWVSLDLSENAYRLGKARGQKFLGRIPSGPRMNPKRYPERPQNISGAFFFRVGIYPEHFGSDGSESRRVYPGIFAKSCGKWVGIGT